MEFNCPSCQTKLRVADDKQNARIRCRACGTIFRPFESAGSSGPRERASAVPPVNPARTPNSSFESPAKPDRDRFSSPTSPAPAAPRPVVTPRRALGGRKGGWGIIFFIILMLLSRGPRLLRNFQRQPAPPPPVQVDDDELMRQLREIRERADVEDLEDTEAMPALPEGADPNDLQLDGETP